MNRTRLRLVGLLIAHVAAAVALGRIDENHLASVLAFALHWSQIGLLAVWLAFGASAWPWRVGSFLAGVAALLSWHWTDIFDSLSLVLFIGAELTVAAGLLVARYGPPKLRLIELGDTVFPSTRFQFSLRQIMVLVAVVAVLLTVAKPIRAYALTATVIEEHEEDGIVSRTESVADTAIILFFGTVLLGVVIVNWVATWASLGIAGLPIRIAIALGLTLSLGLLETYCVAPFFDNVNLYQILAQFVAQSIFTMASLMVVRSCGFRRIGRREMAT